MDKIEYKTREDRAYMGVRDENNLRSRFAMIPHIIDDIGLSVYAYRLYGHLVRVAGEDQDGSCWQSTTTLAVACGISKASVSKARKELARKGLIRITLTDRINYGKHGYDITIVDVWEDNFIHCNNIKKNRHVRHTNKTCSPHEQDMFATRIKEELITKNPSGDFSEKNKNNQTASPKGNGKLPAEIREVSQKTPPEFDPKNPEAYFLEIEEERNLANPPPKNRTAEEIKASAARHLQDYYEREQKEREEGRKPNIENFIGMLPERCRETARVFCYHKDRPPLKDEASYWRKGFDAWADLGIEKEHVEYAIREMERKGLTIKSPDSLRSIAEQAKEIIKPVSQQFGYHGAAVVSISDAARKLLEGQEKG